MVKVKEEPIKLADYELVNLDKYRRSLDILGSNPTDIQILTAYDKLGGLIKKNGKYLPMGTFWNFKDKKAVEAVKAVEEVETPAVETPTRKTRKK